MLALGAIEAGEARAGAGRVVAQASARAVSAGLVTVPVQRIRARRTLYMKGEKIYNKNRFD